MLYWNHRRASIDDAQTNQLRDESDRERRPAVGCGVGPAIDGEGIRAPPQPQSKRLHLARERIEDDQLGEGSAVRQA
jgi:hypothetical protein